MDAEFLDLTAENIADEHLCCIIRTKKPHPGVEAKREWLAARLREGHVFRKLNTGDCVFIEYAPLETAWTPVVGKNYMYIYCLWVLGAPRGSGYGRALMEYCIADAKAKGKSGICMLGAKKQKSWLSDQSFAKKFGFAAVDSTADGYELLALSFDGGVPRFAESAKRQRTDAQGLLVYYDFQCPFIQQRVDKLREYCAAHGIPAAFELVDSLGKAKSLPCVFNNWAAFWNGSFISVNQLDGTALEKIIRRAPQP